MKRVILSIGLLMITSGHLLAQTPLTTNNLTVDDGTFNTVLNGNNILFSRSTGPAYIWSQNVGGLLSFGTNGRGTSNSNANLVLKSNINSYFNGKLGIGTTSPIAQLHLYSNNGTEYNTFFDTNSMNFDTPSNTPSYINKKDTGSLQFRMGASYKTAMTINNNGKVGIGTTNPGGLLDIYSDISTDHWVSRMNTNGSNWSGFWEASDNIYLILRDDTGNTDVYLRPNGSSYFNGGNVGIGTTTPSSLLTLNSTSGSVITLQHNNLTKSSIIGELDGISGGNLEFWTREDGGSNTQKMVIKPTGNVGIGTATPDAKLAVNGIIHTKEVKVDLVGWSDFVFNKNYKLPTLLEVEQHIKDKGHLQDIPSAEEVAKNGFFLGEMDSKLLQKIEELTLYTIEQQKQIEAQNNIIKAQNNKIENLGKENVELQSLSDRLAKIEMSINNKH